MLPKYVKIEEWAASLLIDFPNDDIPILQDEKDWKDWGNRLVEIPTFLNSGAPSTVHFDDSQKWMDAVYFTMSNYA